METVLLVFVDSNTVWAALIKQPFLMLYLYLDNIKLT